MLWRSDPGPRRGSYKALSDLLAAITIASTLRVSSQFRPRCERSSQWNTRLRKWDVKPYTLTHCYWNSWQNARHGQLLDHGGVKFAPPRSSNWACLGFRQLADFVHITCMSHSHFGRRKQHGCPFWEQFSVFSVSCLNGFNQKLSQLKRMKLKARFVRTLWLLLDELNQKA